jgi:arylsulfatase A-like enzyme
MKYNQQRAYRDGDWKYLKINENEYLFNLSQDARERANQVKSEPERLDTMRARFELWESQVPAVPEEARFHLPFTIKDMPSR